jgi:hypothetical protein
VLFGFDLSPELSSIFKPIEPVLGEGDYVAVHGDNPGLLQHGQAAPAEIPRPLTVEGIGYLLQGENPAAGVESVEDSTSSLTQPLYCRAWL